MAIITITYTPAVQFKTDVATQQIFGVWNPATTASDNPVFFDTDANKPTYYQTNRWDNGEFPYAKSLEAFLAEQVAHPGLIAALRAAVRAYDAALEKDPEATSGEYPWVAPDEDALYVEELKGALKDQGFTFEIDDGSGEG